MILITGSQGYLGKNLTHFFFDSSLGTKLLLTHRNPVMKEGLVVNLNNEKEVLKLFENDIEFIIHAAYDWENVNSNIAIVQNIIKLCNISNAQLIYISSYDVNFSDMSLYGAIKKKCENIIISKCNSYIILRPTVLFGGIGERQFAKMKTLLKFHVAFDFGQENMKIAPLHVFSLSDVVLKLIQKEKVEDKKIIELSGIEVFTWNEVVDIMCNNVYKIRIPRFATQLFLKIFTFIGKDTSKIKLLLKNKVPSVNHIESYSSLKFSFKEFLFQNIDSANK